MILFCSKINVNSKYFPPYLSDFTSVPLFSILNLSCSFVVFTPFCTSKAVTNHLDAQPSYFLKNLGSIRVHSGLLDS